MLPPRPDLSHTAPEVTAYIEALELEIESLRAAAAEAPETAMRPSDAAEAPTTFNVVTISAGGMIKRTPRHLYNRQRRGGMGIFDLETPAADRPAFLVVAEESRCLVLLTDQARAFRLKLNNLPAAAVHSRGIPLAELLPIRSDEQPAAVLVEQSDGYLTLLSRSGWVRRVPAYICGESMTPGTLLYKTDDFGPLAAAAWTPGNADLFIVTRHALAVRFPERLVALPASQGIRLENGDMPLAIAGVRPETGIFLLGADGMGTIRLMSGFNAHKAPGAGGKIAMKTAALSGAAAITPGDDLFVISRLNKIIRFSAGDVPSKADAVQGVRCMALRGDEAVAVARSPAAP